MRIQNNITAMNAQRNLSNNNNQLSSNLEKLSSGYRINRAADDAAGLAISEKMRAQITGLETAETNANDGISLVQTAEGALTEVHSMLNRMVELAMKASNGTYSESERSKLQSEVDQLLEEIDRIAESTTFNGIPLLSSDEFIATEDIPGGDIASSQMDFNNLTDANGDAVVFEGVTGSVNIEATGMEDGATISFETKNAYVADANHADLVEAWADADILALYESDPENAIFTDPANATAVTGANGKTYTYIGSEAPPTEATVSAAMDADGNITISMQGFVDANGTTQSVTVTDAMLADALANITVTDADGNVTTGMPDGVEVSMTVSDLGVDEDGNAIEALTIGKTSAIFESETVVTGTGVPEYVGKLSGAGVSATMETDTTLYKSDGTAITTGIGINFDGLDASVKEINFVELSADEYEAMETAGDLDDTAGVGVGFDNGTLTVYLKSEAGGGVKSSEISAALVASGYATAFDITTSADGAQINDGTCDVITFGSQALADGTSKDLFSVNISGAIDASLGVDGNNDAAKLITDTKFGTVAYTASNVYEAEGLSTDGTVIKSGTINIGNIVDTADTTAGGTAGDITASTGAGFTMSFATGDYDVEVGKTVSAEMDDSGNLVITLTGAANDTFTDMEIMEAIRNASNESDLDISSMTFESGNSVQIGDYHTVSAETVKALTDAGVTAPTDGAEGYLAPATTNGTEAGILLDQANTTPVGSLSQSIASNVVYTETTTGADASALGGTASETIEGEDEPAPLDPIVIQVGNSSDDYNKVIIERMSLSTADLFPAILDTENTVDANGLTADDPDFDASTATNVFFNSIGKIDITTSQESAVAALDAINAAIDLVSDVRSNFGAIQNRLDHTINNLGVAVENMQSAESRVRDVDMAAEMMEYTKNNILVQSAQAMLAQANQVPQGVLQLLQ